MGLLRKVHTDDLVFSNNGKTVEWVLKGKGKDAKPKVQVLTPKKTPDGKDVTSVSVGSYVGGDKTRTKRFLIQKVRELVRYEDLKAEDPNEGL